MSIRKVNFVSNEYYHIYNRGNSKQKIFNNKEDYQRFLSLLYNSNNSNGFNFSKDNHSDFYQNKKRDCIVGIGSYCLMPNHFHILITEISEGGITKFMQKLSTGYAMYYNKKYQRTGSLFEGKFKSEYAGNERYLKYLFSYIHLNPIKLIQKDWKEKGIKNKKIALMYLEGYTNSSYLDFVWNKRIQKNILSPELFPDYFPTKDLFRKEILEWLNYNR